MSYCKTNLVFTIMGLLLYLEKPAFAQIGISAPQHQVLVEGASPQARKTIQELNNVTGSRELSTISNDSKDFVIGVPASKTLEWKNGISELKKKSNSTLNIQNLQGDYRALLHSPADISKLTPEQSKILDLQRKTYGAKNISVFKISPPTLANRVLRKGFDAADGFLKPGSFLLPLEAGRTISVEPEAVSTIDDGEVLWKGHVQESAHANASKSDATIISKGENLTGNIRIGTDYYSIMPIGEGLHVISKREPAQLPKEHPPHHPSPKKNNSHFDSPPTAILGPNETAVIDILFAFSKNARKLRLDYKELASLVATDLQTTIDASGINGVSVKNVGVLDLEYQESNQWSKHWNFITDKSNKTFRKIFQERDARKADIVIFILADATYCGETRGDLPVDQENAVAIVSVVCLEGPMYSASHEIGHMLGALHDRTSDPSSYPFKWGHGYVNPQNRWRTIMAYDVCSCSRIPRWSNPDVNYDGLPTGTREFEFDAKAWMMRAKITSKFR
jgi:hypothetical protein